MERRRKFISSSLGDFEIPNDLDRKQVLSVEDPTEDEYFEDEDPVYNREMTRREADAAAFEKRQKMAQEFAQRAEELAAEKKTQRVIEESPEEIRQRLSKSKEQIKSQNQRAPKNTVDRMEVLVGISRLTKEVDIDGTIFSIRSLKSREMREIMKYSEAQETKLDQLLSIKLGTLAYSIYEIDGNSFDYICKSGDLEDKIEVVDDFDNFLVKKLWNEYSEMVAIHNDSVKADLGSTSKEFSENLKK
jgi:hypothetical protein